MKKQKDKEKWNIDTVLINKMLLEKLDNLNFNIYLVVLYLQDTSVFEKRIKRDKQQ